MNEFKGHVGIGPAVEGIALAAHDNFSTRYDLDRDRGIVSRPSHKLYGENYVGRILVLNAAKGGVASAWMLREMVRKEMAPRAGMPLPLPFASISPSRFSTLSSSSAGAASVTWRGNSSE